MLIDNAGEKNLRNITGDNIRFNEPMSRHTSLRAGGPADIFTEPEDIGALIAIVKWASSEGIPYLIIGGGSNLLVRDNGIRGLVISLKKCLTRITLKSRGTDLVEVSAGAGARLQALCSFAIDKGLKGMNFAIGIPGSVGGAIMMNAGTRHGFMEKVLYSVNFLMPDGKTKKINKADLDFHYRELVWNSGQDQDTKSRPIITSGKFLLTPANPAELKKEAESFLLERNKKQPVNMPSAGCFFKNPRSGMTAGELIDKAGLKGESVGGAGVSREHANFIINRDNASAEDIITLMEKVRQQVDTHFNILLEPEVEIVGE